MSEQEIDHVVVLDKARKEMLETGHFGDGTSSRFRDAFYAQCGRSVGPMLDEIRRLRAVVEPLEKLLGENGNTVLIMCGANGVYRIIAANATGRNTDKINTDKIGDTLTQALAAAAEGCK